jgi:hypothetical protein
MNIPAYSPGHFEALAYSPLGQELWPFLNDPQTCIRMQTATDLGRPAVEGIEEQLLERFGEQLLDDRVKQMIGHMTRQVMERLGYQIDQQDVKVTNGAPFARATRYVRRNEVIYYVFRHPQEPRTVLLTLSRTASLPQDAAWQYWKSLRGELRACVFLQLPEIRKATKQLQEAGFYRHSIPRMLRAA